MAGSAIVFPFFCFSGAVLGVCLSTEAQLHPVFLSPEEILVWRGSGGNKSEVKGGSVINAFVKNTLEEELKLLRSIC